MTVKNELQNIISGISQSTKGATIQAITRYIKQAKEQIQQLKKKSSSKSRKQR